MRGWMKRIGIYALVLAVCVAAFTVLLTAAYSIPNARIAANCDHAMSIFGIEGTYPNYLYYSYGSQMDNATDRLMIRTARIQDESQSALASAMSMNGYSRYWHGIQVLLRPALTVLSYVQIRYLNMFLLLGLFTVTFSLIWRKLGLRYAVSFAVSVTAVYLVVLPASLQFMPVFVIAFAASVAVLQMGGKALSPSGTMLFFLTGIFTSFFDLLTVPLITFGIPGILIVLMQSADGEAAGLGAGLRRLFRIGLAWIAGYALCWASKWLLAGAVLGTDAIGEALNVAGYRIAGADQYGHALNRMYMLKQNFFTVFPEGRRALIGVFALFALMGAAAVLFPRPRRTVAPYSALLLFVALPYAFYLILANHSQIHFWFTCRLQAVALFALLSFLLACIDTDRLKRLFRRAGNGAVK